MQAQHRLLFDTLHRHKAHPRPLAGFPDRLGIGRVGLVRLHKRTHELRRDQRDLMAQALQQPAPVVR